MNNSNTLKAVLFHLPFIFGFWLWLYKRYPFFVDQLSITYKNFGMQVPQATNFSIKIFSNHFIAVSIVTLLSLLPALLLKNKSKYFGIAIPILATLASIFFLYLPIIMNGAVV